MELQYLKYFSSVADTLSFSEAAKKCRVSQPALSAQIRILEDRLGTQLFHRSKRTVTLTKEGQALIPRVKKILMELDGLSTAAKDLQNPLSGTMFVGATPLIPHTIIFDKLSVLSKENTDLRLSFTEGGSNALIDGLLSSQLDIIFVPYREKLRSPQIQYSVTEKLDVAICTPKGGNKGLPFINIKPGCGLGEFMSETAKNMGTEASHTMQATHIEMVKKWIQMGIGWSILPVKTLSRQDEKKFVVQKSKSLKAIEICSVMLRGQRAESVLGYFKD